MSVRLDKYLWAIRMFKSRTLADKACSDGKVKMGDQLVKSSRDVVVGDVYTFRTPAGKRQIRVIALLDKRLGFADAIKYYEDLTPPEWNIATQSAVFHDRTGKRGSRSGRPTKRNRRELGEWIEPGDDAAE